MTYNVLFLDVDGTILKPDHTYTKATKQAIANVKKQGVEVFIATGRPLHEIGNLAKELHVNSFIGYNGAFALYQNQTIVNEPMKKQTVEEFAEITSKHEHELLLYTRENNYYTSLADPVVRQFIETFQLKKNKIYTDKVTDKILGATVMNVPSNEVSLYEIKSDIHLSPVNVAGAVQCYDIIRKNVNKGNAVRKILDLLQIKPAQAIAFGDGMNDKEMLQSVGESFAMGNAHPDLFAYAKHKTASVTEDGIANGLKKLGL